MEHIAIYRYLEHHHYLHHDHDLAQAARDARGRVVAAEGEHRASRALKHAAEV